VENGLPGCGEPLKAAIADWDRSIAIKTCRSHKSSFAVEWVRRCPGRVKIGQLEAHRRRRAIYAMGLPPVVLGLTQKHHLGADLVAKSAPHACLARWQSAYAHDHHHALLVVGQHIEPTSVALWQLSREKVCCSHPLFYRAERFHCLTAETHCVGIVVRRRQRPGAHGGWRFRAPGRARRSRPERAGGRLPRRRQASSESSPRSSPGPTSSRRRSVPQGPGAGLTSTWCRKGGVWSTGILHPGRERWFLLDPNGNLPSDGFEWV
jgi:hypothetical protein